MQARIRMPVSYCPHSRNLIDKLVSYKKVISVPNSVTLIEDLFPALEELIKIRPVGILNLTNERFIEHKQILDSYRQIVNPGHEYEIITLDELEGGIIKSKRSNCVLSIQKVKSLGINMPILDEKRLLEVMRIYKQNL